MAWRYKQAPEKLMLSFGGMDFWVGANQVICAEVPAHIADMMRDLPQFFEFLEDEQVVDVPAAAAPEADPAAPAGQEEAHAAQAADAAPADE